MPWSSSAESCVVFFVVFCLEDGMIDVCGSTMTKQGWVCWVMFIDVNIHMYKCIY